MTATPDRFQQALDFMVSKGWGRMFDLSPAQKAVYAKCGTEEEVCRIILAKLVARDKSALIPTQGQLLELKKLLKAMGLPPLETDALDRIREAVNASECTILDYVIPPPNSLWPIHIAETGKPIWEGFVDVPIKAIIDIGHKNFLRQEVEEDNAIWTWRTAATKRLRNTWSNFVLDYFESKIRDAPLPADGSHSNLRLWTVGGAVICENGIHRTTGAIAWLAAKYGEGAVLKKVRLEVHGWHEGMIDKIIQLRNEFGILKILARGDAIFLRVDDRAGTQTFQVQRGELVPKIHWRRWSVSRILRPTPEILKSADWNEFPVYIIDAWERRSWLSAAMRNGEPVP